MPISSATRFKVMKEPSPFRRMPGIIARLCRKASAIAAPDRLPAHRPIGEDSFSQHCG
jgi:hypothetical protein